MVTCMRRGSSSRVCSQWIIRIRKSTWPSNLPSTIGYLLLLLLRLSFASLFVRASGISLCTLHLSEFFNRIEMSYRHQEKGELDTRWDLMRLRGQSHLTHTHTQLNRYKCTLCKCTSEERRVDKKRKWLLPLISGSITQFVVWLESTFVSRFLVRPNGVCLSACLCVCVCVWQPGDYLKYCREGASHSVTTLRYNQK